ncbi:hypothetical protein GHT09_003064 [Marmota monax]|uniref:Uncharacterized protein n=1 Tax=Marmota monax TaxID=9995 RepID=A0A834PVM3_MARMO|nr:hypothetical protein GHT09_003064 [Marmota monax]
MTEHHGRSREGSEVSNTETNVVFKPRHAGCPRKRDSELQRLFKLWWQLLVLGQEVWTKPEETPLKPQVSQPPGVLPKPEPGWKCHCQPVRRGKRAKQLGQEQPVGKKQRGSRPLTGSGVCVPLTGARPATASHTTGSFPYGSLHPPTHTSPCWCLSAKPLCGATFPVHILLPGPVFHFPCYFL